MRVHHNDDFDPYANPLGPARGCLIAIGLGIAFWVVIGVIAWFIL